MCVKVRAGEATSTGGEVLESLHQQVMWEQDRQVWKRSSRTRQAWRQESLTCFRKSGHCGWLEKVQERHVRRAGTWDPLLQGLHLDKHLLQQPNARNLQGTKNYGMHVQLGPIMNAKIQKDQKSNCHFWWGLGSKSRVLCMIPGTAPLRGWADQLSHLSTPTVTPFKGQTHPRLREQAWETTVGFCSLVWQHESQYSLA